MKFTFIQKLSEDTKYVGDIQSKIVCKKDSFQLHLKNATIQLSYH